MSAMPTGYFVISSTAVYCGVAIIILLVLSMFYVSTIPATKWSGKSLKSWTVKRIPLLKFAPLSIFTATILLAKKSKLSHKARATDAPSWIFNFPPPHKNEKAEHYAKRLLDAKYGKENYKTGPGSEYSKIKKYAQRNLGLK